MELHLTKKPGFGYVNDRACLPEELLTLYQNLLATIVFHLASRISVGICDLPYMFCFVF